MAKSQLPKGLRQAMGHKVLTRAEAHALHRLIQSAPPGVSVIAVPEPMWPLLERLRLWQAPSPSPYLH